jgi:hypothetical protein
MERTDAGAGPTAHPADRLERLSATARGWHTIQLAALGFIGICGVLRTADSPAPRAVQVVAAALAVAALAVATTAIFAVGRVAYPLGEASGAATTPLAAQAAARLRTGIRLTIVAMVLAVVAALSGWWPASPAAATATAAVAVTATSGQAWCGPVVTGPGGAISVRTGNGIITIPAQVIARVRPVTQCP